MTVSVTDAYRTYLIPSATAAIGCLLAVAASSLALGWRLESVVDALFVLAVLDER